MTWTCAEYDCWLDDGRPDRDKAAADAHAAGCARCAAALAAARSVEEALALPLAVAAPSGFSDAVMRYVSSADAIARTGGLSGPAMPWWLRTAVSPLAIALATLAGLLTWQLPALGAEAARLAQRLAAWGDQAQRSLATVLEILAVRSICAEPVVLLSLAVGIAAPSLLWLGWHLARWSERAVSGRAIRAGFPL